MGAGNRRARILVPVVALTAGALILQAQNAPTTRSADATTRQAAAQDGPAQKAPAAANDGAAVPGAAKAVALRPATGPAETQPASRPTKLTLNFKDAPLDAVLDYLSDVAGFVIVKEGPVDGRVTVLSKQPVTRAEAVAILNAALKANGFVAMQSGRELKIVQREKARKGMTPVHFGGDPEEIADTDELITQVIPVRNVDATKLRQDLTPLINTTDADVTANDGSNTIVITDSSSSIRRIAQIIHAIDQEETTVADMRIVPLKYAKAADAVKLIDAVFKSEGGGGGGQQPGQQGGPMVMGPNGPMPAGGGGGGAAHRVRGKVIAAADERTNIVVISGPADTLKVIDGILQKLDSNPIPASIIRAFPLKYADAQATSKLVDSIFHPQQSNNENPYFYNPFGQQREAAKINVNTAYDDRTNTLIVTAPADAMEQVADLVRSLDANPVSATDIHVFNLKYADSDAVAKLINSIFNPEDQSQSRRFFPFYFFGMNPSEQQRGAKINANSDFRTNTVIVTAPSETMKVISGIVKQIDSNPAAEDTLFIYRLRNAQASNLELVLNTLFGNVQNGQQNPNQQQQNQNQQGNRNSPFGNGNGGGGGGRGLGQNNQNNNNRNRPANQPGSNRARLSPGMAQAVNSLTGEVFVVAEEDTNSLLVTTATKFEKQVKAIIEELDRPVPQVLIKVLVAEVTHDSSADFGTDFSILNTRANGLGQSFNSTFGQPGSGLVVSFVENKLNATLHALAQQNKLDVLSRPYILASDNQLAEILVGQQVPLVQSVYQTELGSPISNYQYQKVGIIVDVTPHINPDGLVTLDVAPEISQLTAQTVNVGPGFSAPVISDRSAQSRVAVRDGQTIVIGGLMQDQKTLTVNKIPILGDIPLIGFAFSRTQISKTKTELLIFLTPHVAAYPDALEGMSQQEMKGTRLTPNAVSPGVFQEHIRGMERGQAPQTRPSQPVHSFYDVGETRPATEPVKGPASGDSSNDGSQ